MGDKQSFYHGFQSFWSETLIKTTKIFLSVSMEILRDLFHALEGLVMIYVLHRWLVHASPYVHKINILEPVYLNIDACILPRILL